MQRVDPRSASVATICPYCGVGCGVLATPDGCGGAAVAGDPAHPANQGRLCSKGSALHETLSLDDRLLHPMLRAGDGLRRATWDAALDHVAQGFARITETHGPQAVAFYLSGQLLTEDYYAANKLIKGFIGSPHVDTNSRLCMASTVAGHKRALGADVVPGCYEDLDCADLIVLVGSNAAWCHPILFQRMLRNKQERGAKIVVIDPRRTATAEEADLFLPIAPGGDVALFCGLLVHLVANGATCDDYIAQHTEGFAQALDAAREIAPTIAATATATGLREVDVAAFFELFATTPKTVTAFSQGVNQSAQGTDKVDAIIHCHLATGRIGAPGAAPFSLTGQPNAMGGREVGGLANQLAAHMGFSSKEVDRVRRFWNAPRIAAHEGLKAVQMFEAIARGEIKALWVMGTNPAVSLPRADDARAALAKLDLFVVSDNVSSNDTINAGAHVLLPAQAWGEKSGTVTNSERRISRQRAFLPSPGEAKPDWRIVSDVATRMGFGDAFRFRSAADVFREHAVLSAFENDGARSFDIGGLATLSDEAYDALHPTLWPIRAGETQGRERFFGEGGFFTANGKARFVAPEPPSLKTATTTAFPFRLNTGRIRDQWHTMTRTGKSPRLARHSPFPFVEIHPADAAPLGLVDNGFACVSTRHGECLLAVSVTDRQRRGQLFAPIHWSDETSSFARVGSLVAAIVDPHSGQPEAKATPARIDAVAFKSRGFLLSRAPLRPTIAALGTKVAVAGGHGLLFASDAALASWRDYAASLGGEADIAEYLDEARGLYRVARFREQRVDFCLFVGREDARGAFDAATALFETGQLGVEQRKALLSGRSPDGAAQDGPIVCACFGVGARAIDTAITNGARSVAAIGETLRAGTNCGSCIPELKRAIAAARACCEE
ncbi:molybdopterin-dependent oxidoreductase [Methylosinus sporium]|uniref:nitrate reductase n=1 Tax=Methylosinus sporium TaxID=428 RepID=UPI00383BB3E0